ncbi:MAG: WcbI family polysaccharide biosynthesis putative acetyltransferase [Mycobacterium kyogaense]|uniref:WcbI family polysaccharide biosynthesis putative acetyltransferase n=1 Tax=Mycobacterium kyogaense TaxID=2212479 RepID=UPI002FF5BA85
MDFFSSPAKRSPRDEPLWLVVGNCQAEALRRVLDSVPARPYQTVRIPPVHELTQRDLPHLNELLGRAAVLLSQPIRPDYRDLPVGTRQLAERLDPGARVVRWPVIRYAGLYPFQVIVRRPADRSLTPPVVPYHDLRTIAAARAGRSPDDPWDVDVSAEQIRAVAALSRDELAMREARDCDVGISDLLAGFGVDAAHTINHPGNPVLIALAQRILDHLDVAATAIPVDTVLLSSVTAPLQPRVLDALGVTGTPRPDWCQHSTTISAQDVHTAQLRWYDDNRDFCDLAVQRHGNVMDSLGLLTRSA